ncbi:tail fiber protein [Paenibacillus sp. UMB4589-SE434]|uniref:tail fiber protein n=1 Tax=Paenibacillus sp. UMB4589-SE434 TaxID=3046314 RepID=UPI00254EF24F|nr:tail fiber protein [Paenibacillus sp. UMB4589-SE434]MDK8182120.1 tail fiber protein [Paenibacillus sp. UMB4589-SE434]
MAQLTMYPAVVNSPGTELAAAISVSDTTITLVSVMGIPAAPNLLTIGSDETAETIRYTAVNGKTLTVERAFQGAAKSWSAGAKVARYFTAYDYDALRQNVGDLDASKETPAGAQAKANTAEANAKNASASKVHAHAAGDISSGTLHVDRLPKASTGAQGIVQLNNATNSPATDQAATAAAVKAAMDQATAAFTSASDGKNQIAEAITGKGVPAAGSDTFPVLSNKIGQIQTGVKKANGTIPEVTTVVENYAAISITVTGLTFKPSLLQLRTYDNQTDGDLYLYSYGANLVNNFATNNRTKTTKNAVATMNNDGFNVKIYWGAYYAYDIQWTAVE